MAYIALHIQQRFPQWDSTAFEKTAVDRLHIVNGNYF